MNEEAHAGILLAIGALALRLSVTDDYLAYVKVGMRPLLMAAGVVLVALGGVVLLGWNRSRGGSETEADAPDGHHHGHVPRVAWLLVLPVLAIGLVAPDPLGAFAAGRVPERLPERPTAPFEPLPPPRDGAVDLTLTEFRFRSLYDEDRGLEGVRVRLVGFVAPGDGAGFTLVRFVLSCCAADGAPVRVSVRGVDPPFPPTDSWVEVVGIWYPGESGAEDPGPPEIVASTVRPVAAPAQPYES